VPGTPAWDRQQGCKKYSVFVEAVLGGQFNISYNCLDRPVETWRKSKAAIIWEGEPGEVRTLTYQELLTEVQKFANVLKKLGIKQGNRVAIYMGMTPEPPIACWRAHTSVLPFGCLRRLLGQMRSRRLQRSCQAEGERRGVN
jgi:acyl-CoA synthetase (AMP-forming)/AMP-acid ligase II